MIRNPEQTIGKLADRVSDVVCSFIDDQGYPETWTLPQACRREGICRFWFEVEAAAFSFPGIDQRPASLYFMDQRFYRGVCLKGWLTIIGVQEDLLPKRTEVSREKRELEESGKNRILFTAKSGRYYSHFQSSDFIVQ